VSAILFFDWPHSPFCMKVRAMLDYKGLEYRTVNPLAARKTLRNRGTGKVPAVEIDGTFVTDSTDIAYALEERWPDPPLIPGDPRDRGLCHAIEEWADESLYFLGLYYRWFEREGRKPIASVFGTSLKGRLAYRYYLRLIFKQLRGQGTLRKPPEHVAGDLERQLDAVEDLLTDRPYVLGQQPYLCDFALWGQLNYLNRTPVAGGAIRKRPKITEFIKRTAPSHL
jgi:glutathione S-transferase